MTISTKELQTLLDQSAPGLWEVVENGRLLNINTAHGDTIATDVEPEEGALMVLAPVLAAEVIRLRTESEKNGHLRFLLGQAAENGVLQDAGLWEIEEELED